MKDGTFFPPENHLNPNRLSLFSQKSFLAGVTPLAYGFLPIDAR